MINVLGLCKYLKDNFPDPVSPSEIGDAIVFYLGYQAPEYAQNDALKSLTTRWKRSGWAWSEAGAVKLKAKEEALFHKSGVTILSPHKLYPDVIINYFVVKSGAEHPRVVWFK